MMTPFRAAGRVDTYSSCTVHVGPTLVDQSEVHTISRFLTQTATQLTTFSLLLIIHDHSICPRRTHSSHINVQTTHETTQKRRQEATLFNLFCSISSHNSTNRNILTITLTCKHVCLSISEIISIYYPPIIMGRDIFPQGNAHQDCGQLQQPDTVPRRHGKERVFPERYRQ